MALHGTFHWNERLTRDAEGIKTFYQDTIGWTFDSMPTPDGKAYWIATVDGKQVGGIFSIDAPEFDGVSEAWMSYLAVDDVDTRAHAWDLFRAAPEPLGHDPYSIWPEGPASPDAGVLRLTPWRLRVATMETLLGRAPVLRRSLEGCPTS